MRSIFYTLVQLLKALRQLVVLIAWLAVYFCSGLRQCLQVFDHYVKPLIVAITDYFLSRIGVVAILFLCLFIILLIPIIFIVYLIVRYLRKK